jgi:hypothetical protein
MSMDELLMLRTPGEHQAPICRCELTCTLSVRATGNRRRACLLEVIGLAPLAKAWHRRPAVWALPCR